MIDDLCSATKLDEGGLAPSAAAAVTIVVCDTCRRPGDADTSPRAGALLADATLAAASGSVRVRRVSCLANCKRGPSAAILRDGGWSYVFGDLDPATAGPDLVTGAALLADAADGLMPWRGRPVSLKRGMIARIPSLHVLEEMP